MTNDAGADDALIGQQAARRVAVRASSEGVAALRRGSPWLFDGSITHVAAAGGGEASAGDLAVVFDQRRRFVAIGLWDPDSPIRVKVLHVGSPVTIDRNWWSDRIARALERRDSLLADPRTNAYRLIHGENDGLPGLVVDRYDDTLVIKVYTPALLGYLDMIVELLVAATGAERVVGRTSRRVSRTEAVPALLHGEPLTGPVRFRERGLRFEANLLEGDKTGHYLDQRENRGIVRSMAAGTKMLDLFSNSGGFAVSAAAGGAVSVHLVDRSAAALEVAATNFSLNASIPEVGRCATTFEAADVFEVLEHMRRDRRRFDLVVVDPPSFASSQRSVPAALSAYARLAGLAASVVAPGGALVQASCSARVPAEEFFDIVVAQLQRSGRDFVVERRSGHPLDHPVGFDQGAYLKAIFVRFDPE